MGSTLSPLQLVAASADATPGARGKALSLHVRAGDPSGRWDGPLVSQHAADGTLAYRLFAADLGDGHVIAFELRTDWSDTPLRIAVPLERIGPHDRHDIIVRYSGARLELFVDGVLVDEEWPIGSLRLADTPAESTGAVEEVTVWDRALSDDEVASLSGGPEAVSRREREILGPPEPIRQYWRPRGLGTAVGDCMPFYHEGRFHLFYLFDRRRHRAKWGLGAHQWAHASTTDLVHWDEHPMAIPITEEWEGSICTGSVFFHEGTYYAFYAVRRPDYTQHLAVATSEDGVHFTKQGEFLDPPAGYDPLHFRDPKVFRDPRDGRLRMLVTARLEDGRDGCIAQLESRDARNWELADPFLVPGRVTDCPDYFEWNGWHYLLAEHVYWMAPDPDGPWVQPDPDRLDVLYVPKTAEFGEGRRIYASWLPEGGWGGDLIFRELIQLADGRLGTRFAPEVMPALGDMTDVEWRLPREGVTLGDDRMTLRSTVSVAEAGLVGIPTGFHLRLQVEAKAGAFRYAIGVGDAELRVTPAARTVEIVGHATIRAVEALDGPLSVEVYRVRDIVDVCVTGRRTVIARVPRRAPASEPGISLFADHAEVEFRGIEVRPVV